MTILKTVLKTLVEPRARSIGQGIQRFFISTLVLCFISTLALADNKHRLSPRVQNLLLQAQQVFVIPAKENKKTATGTNTNIDTTTNDEATSSTEPTPKQLTEQSAAAVVKLQTLSLNDYEQALFHKIQASIALHQSNYEEALIQFEKAWKINIFEASEQRKLQHIVSQLAFNQEDWKKTIQLMEDWLIYSNLDRKSVV